MELGLKVRPTTTVDRPYLGSLSWSHSFSILILIRKRIIEIIHTRRANAVKRSINRRTVTYLPSLYGNWEGNKIIIIIIIIIKSVVYVEH